MSRRAIKKIGILGFGNLGRYLYEHMPDGIHPVFVWNRTSSSLDEYGIPLELRLPPGDSLAARTMSYFEAGKELPDLIVEVSHPRVAAAVAPFVLPHCDLMIGSPTLFAHPDLAELVYGSLQTGPCRVRIPTGAAWGVRDIQALWQIGRLETLEVDMTFHHTSLRLRGDLAPTLDMYIADEARREPKRLYQGPIAPLARMAPHNTNTMVSLALAAGDQKLARCTGRLFAKKEDHTHEVRIRVTGPGGFVVETHRINPSGAGQVTGKLTYDSFLASLRRSAEEEGPIVFS